ncbi:MAG: hypothetical protein ACTSW3_10250 [Promethearchaeota archaeon]
MILGSNELENMRRELGKLKKKIKLILFTDVKRREDGTKFRTCSSCEESYHILKKLEELSEGKVLIELIGNINRICGKKFFSPEIIALDFKLIILIICLGILLGYHIKALGSCPMVNS